MPTFSSSLSVYGNSRQLTAAPSGGLSTSQQPPAGDKLYKSKEQSKASNSIAVGHLADNQICEARVKQTIKQTADFFRKVGCLFVLVYFIAVVEDPKDLSSPCSCRYVCLRCCQSQQVHNSLLPL